MKLIGLIGLLAIFGFVLRVERIDARATVQSRASVRQRTDRQFEADATQDFHSWTRANPKPMQIAYFVDALCINPTPEQAARAETNPHRHKFVTVWVNDVGRRSMFDGNAFPVGSAIVKEKRVGLEGSVELSTAMIKRESGFNPGCGDWEFAVLDAQGRVSASHDELKLCASCHVEQSKSDFTFRSYLAR